jgi:hypothetical protein
MQNEMQNEIKLVINNAVFLTSSPQIAVDIYNKINRNDSYVAKNEVVMEKKQVIKKVAPVKQTRIKTKMNPWKESEVKLVLASMDLGLAQIGRNKFLLQNHPADGIVQFARKIKQGKISTFRPEVREIIENHNKQKQELTNKFSN